MTLLESLIGKRVVVGPGSRPGIASRFTGFRRTVVSIHSGEMLGVSIDGGYKAWFHITRLDLDDDDPDSSKGDSQ